MPDTNKKCENCKRVTSGDCGTHNTVFFNLPTTIDYEDEIKDPNKNDWIARFHSYFVLNDFTYQKVKSFIAQERKILRQELTKPQTKIMDKECKECKECDFKNARRFGRADWRCPKCGRNLMLDMVLMEEAGIKILK